MSYFRIFILLSLSFSLSCKDQTQKPSNQLTAKKLDVTDIQLDYSEGFAVSINENFQILTIKNAWPDSDKVYKYALIPQQMLSKVTLNKDEFDAIIATPIKRIVATSTTHIPALELLGVEESLIGFPGTDYISSKITRKRINAGEVSELGKNEGINIEVLLELRPDAVIAFGVDGTNKSITTIKKSSIPVIYNGDWVEKSPLAKAEWIKFFGVLFNKQKAADSIFKQIETNYNTAKTLASKVENRPTVLCGAMHKDVWYLPNGNSPEAQFLNDANVNYLWSGTSGSGSLALSFEAVFDKAKNADIWLNPSYYTSLETLKKANPHYTQFDAFQEKKIYTFAAKTGKTGGVLYYELGFARPDLVLRDMVKICHPELLTDYESTFFEKLK